MINLPEDQWNLLFDKADETIQKVIAELPEPVRKKAEEIPCLLDKYTPLEGWRILGAYMPWLNVIHMYIGQIYEDENKNIDRTMESVRQVYLHELAHAVGDLAEYEVKERGL